MKKSFQEKYGPWAVVAGGSRGMGLAFSRELGRRGLRVVIVSEDGDSLAGAKERVDADGAAECRVLHVDLSEPDAPERIAAFTADLDVGLLVCNATYRDLGPFLDRPLSDHLGVVDVNCRAPVALAHQYGNRMKRRKKGGIIFMASLTAFQGTPFIAAYGASKSFNLGLGEALRFELKQFGVDVLVSAPGATATPNYLSSIPDGVRDPAPVMTPEVVVRQTLDALGRRPVLIPGLTNRVIGFLMGKVFPRRLAVWIMGRNTKKLYG